MYSVSGCSWCFFGIANVYKNWKTNFWREGLLHYSWLWKLEMLLQEQGWHWRLTKVDDDDDEIATVKKILCYQWQTRVNWRCACIHSVSYPWWPDLHIYEVLLMAIKLWNYHLENFY